MGIGTDTAVDFSGAVAEYGELIRIKHYLDSYSGAAYDNAYLTTSGTDNWVKGMHFPVATRFGGEDYKLVEQGRIQLDDRKLFIDPSVNLSGIAVKIGIGSPVSAEYAVRDKGVHVQEIEGVQIYKKAFIRILNTGSFPNEY